MENPKAMAVETKESVFKEVDQHKKTNNFNHHTDEITVEDLIVRRGQSFKVTLSLTKPFNHYLHPLSVTAVTGDPKNASEDLGTRSVFGIPDPKNRSPSAKAVWKIEEDSTSSSLTGKLVINITPPVDAPIGLWKLRVKYMDEETWLAMPYVLFNPWCKEDTVYLEDPKKRKEYVMNEQGIIFRGSNNFIMPKEWDYGQFEKDMVVICVAILDNSHKHLEDPAQDVASRSDPIYVGRVVSAMINSNDDRGVLRGKWGAPYFGGHRPSHWSGSYPILKRWLVSDCHPVNYGQCWVFAGVMCSVMRLLGVPCRVVTNYESAHDTDMTLTIDTYHADVDVPEIPSYDSVWNFHVWNEGWMQRPDLGEEGKYDGWQVLDSTPQERSDGVLCCGPAPVKAVLNGETALKYDVPFVFAEVNADCIDWLVKIDGTAENVYSDAKRVGQNISTKAVGSDKRVNLTSTYKHAEGSEKERSVFKYATTRDYSYGWSNDEDMKEEEEEEEEVEMEVEDEEGMEDDVEGVNENTENTVEVEETEGPEGEETEVEEEAGGSGEPEEAGGCVEVEEAGGRGGPVVVTEPEEAAGPPLFMKFGEVSPPTNGKNVKVQLVLKSNSKISRELSITISVQARNYDGNGSKDIQSEVKEKTLLPGKELSVPIRVPFSAYHIHMVEADSMKITVVVKDKNNPDKTYLAEEDVVLLDPPLTVTVPDKVRVNKEAQGMVVFMNPAAETLTNCTLTLSGSGVWQDEFEMKIPDLKKNNRIRVKFPFTPYKTGKRKIVVDFDCSTFRDIKGSCTFTVK